MKVLHNQDVVRLEGETVAQVWRRPRDDELVRFKDKPLVAVPKGTVSVGMIYRDGRFIRPQVPVDPVVIIQQAQNPSEATVSPQPTPQSHNVSVTVNGVNAGNEEKVNTGAHHSPSASLSSGSALRVKPGAEHENGEPAASAAHHAFHGNVASSGGSDEYQPSFDGFDNEPRSPNLSAPTFQVTASVDQARFAAADYIKNQANLLLEQIPPSREIVREAVAQTVVQAKAKLAEVSTEQEMSLVIEAAAMAIGEYIERSNSGEFGEDG